VIFIDCKENEEKGIRLIGKPPGFPSSVLNLVRLSGVAFYYLILTWVKSFSLSKGIGTKVKSIGPLDAS